MHGHLDMNTPKRVGCEEGGVGSRVITSLCCPVTSDAMPHELCSLDMRLTSVCRRTCGNTGKMVRKGEGAAAACGAQNRSASCKVASGLRSLLKAVQRHTNDITALRWALTSRLCMRLPPGRLSCTLCSWRLQRWHSRRRRSPDSGARSMLELQGDM